MKQCLTLVLVCLAFFSHSQKPNHNFGFKYYGFTVHPKGEDQAHLMPTRLDPNAYMVLNYGGIFSYQRMVFRDFISIKIAQGLYTDSGKMPSGHTHIGFRVYLLDHQRHDVQFGFGPTYIYRKSWHSKEGYESSGIFRDRGNIQDKFVWYGGEIEYNYLINDHWDFSAHILPGFPLVVGFGFGFRYWPNRILNTDTN